MSQSFAATASAHAPLRVSVLDQTPVAEGSTGAAALRNTIDLARLTESLGYHRYWVAEHHGSPMLAGPSPEVLISAIASATSRMRIGSGGVMLPHYSALKVAENFSALAGLFGDRIDLGLGRAAGTDPETAFALQRDRRKRSPDDFPQQLEELLGYLYDRLPREHPFRRLAALPGMPERPEPWLLGSSPQSGVWAAEFGLPYAFADFINPAGADIALFLAAGALSTFAENLVVGCRTGLRVAADACGSVVGGTFFRCGTAIDVAGAGVKTLLDSCSCLLSTGVAIRVASGTLSRCKVLRTTGSAAVDFCATGHHREYGTLTDCEVSCSENDAVRFSGSGVLDKCSVSMCKNGVRFAAGATAVCDVRASSVMDCDKLGVVFATGHNGAVMDSDVFDCGVVACVLEAGASGEIDGSRISSTLDHGAVDMEPGTRVTLRSNVIRNQFAPSHHGKLSGARRRDTAARVNSVLDAAAVDEERATANARWAVELRERLLGDCDAAVRGAQRVMFEDGPGSRQSSVQREGSVGLALPSVVTSSPSRLRSDRGFELADFIATKKSSGAVVPPPPPASGAHGAARRRANSYSAADNNNGNANDGESAGAGAAPHQRRASLSGAAASRSAGAGSNAPPPPPQLLPAVTTRTTASSRAKETEADGSVAVLHRKPATPATTASGPQPHVRGASRSTPTTLEATGRPETAQLASAQDASQSSGAATAARRKSKASAVTVVEPPPFSRVLVHAVGDADDFARAVTATLEETLGLRCSIMRTSASDPVAAMLAAAVCSHVVVVYPTFPMRRRPTADDDKALLAVACYVELALRNKKLLEEEVAVARGGTDETGGGGGEASKPRLPFVGAFCVVQPPPDSGLIGGGAMSDFDAAPTSPDSESALLPRLSSKKRVDALAERGRTSAVVDRSVQLPATFREVVGAAGLYQALTGKKAAKVASSAAARAGSGAPRRKSTG